MESNIFSLLYCSVPSASSSRPLSHWFCLVAATTCYHPPDHFICCLCFTLLSCPVPPHGLLCFSLLAAAAACFILSTLSANRPFVNDLLCPPPRSANLPRSVCVCLLWLLPSGEFSPLSCAVCFSTAARPHFASRLSAFASFYYCYYYSLVSSAAAPHLESFPRSPSWSRLSAACLILRSHFCCRCCFLLEPAYSLHFLASLCVSVRRQNLPLPFPHFTRGIPTAVTTGYKNTEFVRNSSSIVSSFSRWSLRLVLHALSLSPRIPPTAR